MPSVAWAVLGLVFWVISLPLVIALDVNGYDWMHDEPVLHMWVRRVLIGFSSAGSLCFVVATIVWGVS